MSRAHPADSDHVCCGNHAPPAAGITIDDRVVGAGEPVYIVAELSGNHRHDYATAVELIHVAAAAGVDAVKLQTYTADTLTIACDRPDFRIGEGSAWAGRTLHDLYSEACTPWDWQPLLMAEARRLGLQLFFTESEERGSHRGLGLLKGRVSRFAPGVKIPHMGWNEVRRKHQSPLFDGIEDGCFFYFAHSYHVEPEETR